MADAELLLTGDALTLDDLFSCSSGFRNVNIDPSTLAKVRKAAKSSIPCLVRWRLNETSSMHLPTAPVA
jgi:hypothetical protein